MRSAAEPDKPGETTELLDEIEQLRTLLESALEENAGLAAEYDRLRSHMTELQQELLTARAALARQEQQAQRGEPAPATRSETEEELRVAFEELQVLTEELEVANTSLHQTNDQLDARVEQRTQQLQELNAVLQSAEASLRAVADLVPDLLWRSDAEGKADWFNQRWRAYTGQGAEDWTGTRWLDAVHPHDQEAARAAWAAAIAGGEPFEHEHRLRDADGAYRWFLCRVEPLRDSDGRILRWFAAGTDIHDRRSATEALQQSETRFRTLIEGIPQLVWRAVFGGRWTWCSPQWSAHTGQSEAEALDMGWLEALHPDDREPARKAWSHAQMNGVLEMKGRIFHAAEKRYRYFSTRALPVYDEADRVLEWLGTSTDFDDILQLQDQQGVLVAELQHRTRNLMAVVQAITARTLRDATSLEQFNEKVQDRFGALARVEGLLSKRETGVRIAFDLLLREELSAHVDLSAEGPAGRIRLEGPAGISLRSATVQTFALALHELATNATKYGALSDHGGRLQVAWGLRQDAHGPRLWVDWRETGVSDVIDNDAAARGGGYGRELIERALPYQLGASTRYVLEPDGVRCTIDVAVPADHTVKEMADG